MAPERLASYIKPFRRIPSWVASDVVINERIKEGEVDPRLKPWADKDFILKHTAVFAVDTASGDIRLPQSNSMHRGVLVKILQVSKPYVDEYGNCFGQIGVKGCGMVEGDEDKYQSIVDSEDKSPPGLFGDYHSGVEMEVSDNFAEGGGRTSRTLANIILDPQRLLKWSQVMSINGSFYYLPRGLAIIEKNGDVPALCVRLMGADRYADYNTCNNFEEGLFTQERMVQRAAKLLSSEIDGRGEKRFLDKYRLDMSYPFSTHLKELAAGYISRDNLATLIFLQCYFYFYNWGVKDRLSNDKYEGKLTAAFSELDVDLAGIQYDWETSLPGPGYNEHDVGRGHETRIRWFMDSVRLSGNGSVTPAVETNELLRGAKRIYKGNWPQSPQNSPSN